VPGKIRAIVDVTAWLWARRQLLLVELQAVRAPKPPKPVSRRLRFAV
jgi:hypothetical protein